MDLEMLKQGIKLLDETERMEEDGWLFDLREAEDKGLIKANPPESSEWLEFCADPEGNQYPLSVEGLKKASEEA